MTAENVRLTLTPLLVPLTPRDQRREDAEKTLGTSNFPNPDSQLPLTVCVSLCAYTLHTCAHVFFPHLAGFSLEEAGSAAKLLQTQ